MHRLLCNTLEIRYVEFVEKNKVDHKNIITLIKKIIPLFE